MNESNPQQENPGGVSARPLPILRAHIDALDHELLRLLTRRNALVAEVASYKRDHQVPIRDGSREHEIIDDRRARALQLGLPPQMIESLFRLILWGSRNRQATLRAEVPLDVEAKSVAIIGGRGGMGRCMADLFSDLGHIVMIADLETDLSPEEAAEVADVVVVSVPIAQTVSVIEQLGPRVRKDALLMDVTSIKEAPMTAMLAATEAAVVGTHPLFAPSVHALQGQRMVLCRGRGDEQFTWARTMFGARGLVIKETTPTEHDQAMSVVQVLTHFAAEVMGRAMLRLDVRIDETLEFTSPIYLMDLLMTARHFAQSPDLYASIQTSNPATSSVTQAFLDAATELRTVLDQRDEGAFSEMFLEVRDYFGDFTEHALERSSFLIDRLVERT